MEQKKQEKGESYILEEVFEDNYEYEEYFEVTSKTRLPDTVPKRLGIKTTTNTRERVHFEYPDNSTVLIIVPISASDNKSSVKKAQIRDKYLLKFKSLIPEIKLDLKDQLAIRRRRLVNLNDKKLIDKRVTTNRRKGNKELKKSLLK